MSALTAALLVATPFSIAGQDEDLLTFVNDAYTTLAEQASVRATMFQEMTQEISVQGVTINVLITQEGNGAMIYEDGAIAAMEMSLVQTMESDGLTLGAGDSPTVMDMILIDDAFYMRSDAIASVLGRQADEWINLNESGGVIPIDADQFTNLMTSNMMQFALDEDMVHSVKELSGDDVVDQSMRVIVLDFDVQGVLDSPAGAAAFGALDLESLAAGVVDFDDLLREMFDGAEMTMTLWIGAEDKLIYRADSDMMIDADVRISGQSMSMVVDMVQSVTYYDFNAPITIEAPDD